MNRDSSLSSSLPSWGRFQGKVAVITAAASGIGRASALRLMREGATIVAVDMDGATLETVAASCEAVCGQYRPYALDGFDEVAVRACIADVSHRFGHIDVLVNGVGGSTLLGRNPVGVEETAVNDWRSLLSFNVDSMFIFTSAIVPIMKMQAAGKIVNISSIAARGLTMNSSSAYAAGKGAVIAFTRKLARELGPAGINVNAVAPGVTLTGRMRASWEAKTAAEQQALLQQIPLRRLASAEDQAAVISFLASSDADFVSGVCIDVTGGQ